MLTAALLLLADQSAPAAAPMTPPAMTGAQNAPAGRLSLNTPIQDIEADPKGKAVLDADLPTLRTNDQYDSFKAMSLRDLQPYAGDKLPDTLLVKVATDLAKVK